VRGRKKDAAGSQDRRWTSRLRCCGQGNALTHARMQQLHAFFGWSFRSVALAMEVHTTGFHFSLFRITIPLYTILDNSRCFSCFDHLASSAFACVLLEFIHQSIPQSHHQGRLKHLVTHTHVHYFCVALE
jgi:hypothetical protein